MSPNLKNKTNLSSRLDSRLIAYAAVAGATLAAPALPSADATVVNSGTINLTIPANIDGVYLNFVTGATSTASFTGWDWNAYLTNGVLTFFWNSSPAPGSGGVSAVANGPYISLNAGDVVSAASTFSATSGGGGAAGTAAFQVTGTEILGVRFRNEATASTNYGYVVINTTGTTGFPATIVSYSYETSGGAITVVPEPTTFALLGVMAAGALGVRAWRKRKAA